jgi:hypothetical protein
MLNQSLSPGPARPLHATDDDHRCSVRYALGYSRAAGLRSSGRRGWRSAVCTNVSAFGAGLILDEALTPGSLVTLRLPGGPSPGEGITRLACVVHLTPQAEGGWLAGCEFCFRLDDAELKKVRGGSR